MAYQYGLGDAAKVEHQEMVSTPGFLDEAAKHAKFGPAHMMAMASYLRSNGSTSWVVGDPEAEAQSFEDEGRTLRQPAPFRFYAIRDDVDAQGFGVPFEEATTHRVTFLLPEEY